MQPGRGRDVEIEGAMRPVGNAWAHALAYCAIAFTIFWIGAFRVRDLPFIVISGLFAAFGFVTLYFAMRTTLDARAFGAMRLRMAAIAPRAGGRFTGSLRISETAAVRGAVRAELRCNAVWHEGQRREQTLWAEERRFPIRRQVGGSFAILEFDIPAGLPPSEVTPAGSGSTGRRAVRWELQAIAESDGAFRDELYLIDVQSAEGAAAPPADDSLPLEVIRGATPAAPAAPAPQAATPGPLQVSRAVAPKPRVPKPVDAVQDLAEPEVLPPAKPDPGAIALLVAANLVPLAGVAFWGWQVQQVVFVYWMENLVIGGFNVLRILAIEAKPEDEAPGKYPVASKLFLAAFFTLHYGGFCLGHGLFLAVFFGKTSGGGAFETVGGMLARMLHEPVVVAALVALLVSHGWSYFRNYLGRGEYQRVDASAMMSAPYKRIVVTHIFIILGGFLLASVRNQLLPMSLFVLMKVFSDLYHHRAEHLRETG